MRKLAFLVLMGLCLSTSSWAAPEASAGLVSSRSAIPADHSVRALPAISAVNRNSAADLNDSVESDLYYDAELSPSSLMLAIWLPIAGILLALTMEGPAETQEEEARWSLWVK